MLKITNHPNIKLIMNTIYSPFHWFDNSTGFTLVEMLVVILIVGLLAAFAYPQYLTSIVRSRRADAIESLIALQQAQENWRSNNTSYAAMTNLGLNSLSKKGYYNISLIGTPDNTGYTASAVAVDGKSQSNDSICRQLLIEVNPSRQPGAIIYSPLSCWNQ